MIVPMKRASIVTLQSAREETLNQLRDVGVIHVSQRLGGAESGEALREQKSQLEHALALLPVLEKGEAVPPSSVTGGAAVDEALQVADTLIQRAEAREQRISEVERIARDLTWFDSWGALDPSKVHQLAERGVYLSLIAFPPDSAEAAKGACSYFLPLETSKNQVRGVAVVFTTEPPEFPDSVEVAALPEHSPAEFNRLRDALTEEIAADDAWIREQQAHRGVLVSGIEELERELEFSRIEHTMEGTDDLAWLTGFVPSDELDPLREAARSHGWGLVLEDPAEDDPVPTKLQNPKAIRIIQPVFDLLGTVPGYREMDISFFFLLFFIVFFAMIIGDAGYGMILLIGTLFAAASGKKKGNAPGAGTALMIVLSSATVVWGAVTGNWFGYEPFATAPILSALVIPGISISNEASTQLIQYMCFVLGTVHLSIAHVWNFLRGLRAKPRIAALAQLGWLSMVLGLYYLVLQLVIDPQLYPMPDFAPVMIAAGLGTVIVFGAQEAGVSFFVGVGKGVAGIITTVLDSISAFSDIISYIRLFAVGLATLAIATAFNEMAGGVSAGIGGAGGAVAGGLILFLGHTLNLAMGALSVVVHGVRLNMLEFSGHLGMEWTGVEYAPFKTR